MAKEVSEKVKPVILHDTENNRDYTLEFSRDTIKFAEGRGFRLEDVDNFPMSKIPEFFWYSFRMHHPSVSLGQAETLLDRMGGMSEALGKRLGELWAVPFEALAPEKGESKNATVTMEL
ncbi:MAG: DUF5055 domain-containing protein [Treponema sp.]|nr:DUF5055 domain-containing protein [Treponema sp.]